MTTVEPEESADPAPSGVVDADAFERVLAEDGPTIHRGLD